MHNEAHISDIERLEYAGIKITVDCSRPIFEILKIHIPENCKPQVVAEALGVMSGIIDTMQFKYMESPSH